MSNVKGVEKRACSKKFQRIQNVSVVFPKSSEKVLSVQRSARRRDEEEGAIAGQSGR